MIHNCQPTIIVFNSVFRRIFQNLAKQNKVKTMFSAGETVGLTECIIDDTCLVNFQMYHIWEAIKSNTFNLSDADHLNVMSDLHIWLGFHLFDGEIPATPGYLGR